MEAGQHIRDYILEEKIGTGGAGEVWRARHQYLDDTVAIKAIYRHASQGSDFQKRFLEEAKVMASLKHPHIVSVRDFFFLDGMPYLVMTYIAGGSLADVIARRGYLPLTEALAISREILDALNFAHSQGVIHRDVKPSNILVKPDGHVCLVDFGIALVAGKRRYTQFGTHIGTPEYMSPEQIQAQKMDHRTDVYSFGCVLYEMLTGGPPFGSRDAGKSEYAILDGHLHKPPPFLRELNPEVDGRTEAAVRRSLAKNPDQRYGGCQELAKELHDIEPGPPPSSYSAYLPKDGKKSYSPNKFLKSIRVTKKTMYIAPALLFIVLVLVFLKHISPIIMRVPRMNDRTDALRHEIMQLEIETAQLVQQYNKGMVQKGEMEKQEHTLAKKVKEGQKELQILQEEVDKQKKALAEEQQIQNKSQETEAYLKALQDEITRLEDNKAQLDGDIKRLGQLQSRPGLGQLPQNLK